MLTPTANYDLTYLLALILVSVLALLALWQVSPHLTDDSPDLPELKVWIFILNLINTVLTQLC